MSDESRLNKIMPGTQRRVRITVAEEVDVPIPMRNGTFIFRPGQVIENDHVLQMAEDNNILLIDR